MNVNGASDLARLQTMQKQAFTARNGLDRAALELTTGRKASRYDATGGNLTRLFALERTIDRNAVFRENISLTELRLDVMQQGMDRILKPTEAVAIDLSISVSLGDVATSKLHANTSRNTFKDTVSVLNSAVAGQSLFAGTATSRPALANADVILADLDAIAAANTTAAGAAADIDAYFAKPGGAFHTSGYVGSPDDLTPVEIGEGNRLDYSVRADQDEIVDLLRSHALAAVVANGAFAGPQAEQMALLDTASMRLLSAKESIRGLRAEIGIAQFAVETARAQRVAEVDTLNIARAKIIEVDPLEAASNFQSLEVQLESIYMVTARLSGLRFSNFLR